jgi:hypothetical protein
MKNLTECLDVVLEVVIGDKVYIIEVIGTFKKTTEYNEG